MLFKHWRDADKRANEIKAETEAISTQIEAIQTRIADRELDVEARDGLLGEMKDMVEAQNKLKAAYDEAIAARDDLRGRENDQIGLQAIISGQRVASRMEETGDILYASKRYALAWARYIRGEGDAEVRQLISTVDTSAGKIVTPTTLVNRIEDKLKTGGRIVRLCRIENIKGMTEHPVVQSSTNLTWHNETGPVKGEKAINLTSVQIDPQFVAETLAFTKKFEADSIEAFWEWLMAELPDALLRKIDNEILFGAATGTSGIRGILTNTNTLFVQIVSGVILDFNIANLAISALDDGTEDNTTIVMNRRTFFTNIRGLKGADGHPIWTASASEEKPQFYLGGFPVAFNSALPAYDDADIGDAFMVVGDFKAMLLNFPQGMAPNLVRDEITRKKENIVEYLSEIYVGGNITRPGSFAVIQKGDAAVGAVGDIGGFSAGIEFGELQAELAEAKKKIEAFEKEATKAAKAAKVPKADE